MIFAVSDTGVRIELLIEEAKDLVAFLGDFYEDDASMVDRLWVVLNEIVGDS